jgi:nucleoside-diphosphate-sugar epimerase
VARVLIAGCGYTGTALGQLLAREGHEVWGLCRKPERLPASILPLAADLTDPATLRSLPPDLDAVFYTAGSDGREEAAYRAAYVTGPANLIDALLAQGQRPRRLLFTSSTVVYGQKEGEWVDEGSPVSAEPFTRRLLLEGERLVGEGPFPGVAVRLAGIYGPGREGLIRSLREGTAVSPEGPTRYTNRIHRDDVAGVLRHLMGMERPEPLYIGVDHEPSDRGEVLHWLAKEMGFPPPRVGPAVEYRRDPGNKRCSNARLLAAGYRFRHPTFREGYAAILKGT